MTEFYLKDLRFDNELIHEWPFIQVSKEIRLFFKAEASEKNGFKFYAVCWTGHEAGDDFFVLESTTVECMFHGVAYWDGIRHLYMGDEQTDNYGYHYYPRIITEHIATLKALRTLEEKYCIEYE